MGSGGKCVNFAVAISEQSRSPDHVEISRLIYSNLEDDVIYGMSNDQKADMWRNGTVQWNEESRSTKVTH